MADELNYQEDLSIDPDKLDVEWLDQANRYMKYSRRAAKARSRLRKAEEALKVLKSELILKVNKFPEKLLGCGAKPTAPLVEAWYRTQPEYRAGKDEWLRASFEADMLQNAMFAFNQRRDALQDLVKLHGQNYFAGPLEPHNLSKEAKRARDKQIVNEKINTQLNKKKGSND